MLIRSIRAENFMRFSRLDLSGIPARGIVGIEGPNESGKTTLGEALLFALFGRTRASAEAPVQSLIRWGADAMTVEIELTIEPSIEGGAAAGTAPPDGRGRGYLIFRRIDRAGTSYVKVLDLETRREVAAGCLQAADFIAREIRFDFDEFQRSFYHDQYEGRRLHALNEACFQSATGVKHLRDAAAEIRREVETLEREFSYYQKELGRNLALCERYARGAAKLAELAERLSRVEEALGQASRRGGELKRRIDDLRAEAGLRQERAKRVEGMLDLEAAPFAAQVQVLAGERAGAAGGKDTLLPDEGARALDRRLTEGIEELRALAADLQGVLDALRDERTEIERRLGNGPVAGLLAECREVERALACAGRSFRSRLLQAVFLLALTVVAGLLLAARLRDDDLAPLRREGLNWLPWTMGAIALVGASGFAGMLAAAVRHRADCRRSRTRLVDVSAEIEGLDARRSALEAIGRPVPARELGAFAEAAASSIAGAAGERGRAFLGRWRALLLDGEGGLAGKLASLAKIDRDLRSRVLAEVQKIEKQAQEEAAQEKRLQSERDRVEGEAGECRSQTSKKDALEEKNRDLEVSAAEVRAAIDLRLLGSDLLEEAARSVQARLGPSLSRLVKMLIPRLTSGRYRDVKVDEDLEVEVFSSEKNDFLHVHELSGGTSQALSLALRLALSQALVAARARQLQFVFLDEPFQMMDSERAAETMRILRVLSPDLAQFFVIQPDFSEEERRLVDSMVLTRPEGTDLTAALGPAGRPDAGPASGPGVLGAARREGPAHALD
jgi:ABC-type Mn2+/Zn2+ transport system ATPase subunit